MGEKDPALLEIGHIARPHGILGEVKLQTAPEYFAALEGVRKIYLDDSSSAKRIKGRRVHQGALLLKLEGVNTRNDAETLRGMRVSIRVRELPELPDGEYYSHQLVGLHVFEVAGNEIGIVSEVLATGSNDVYIVKAAAGGELLLPAIESVIREIDLEHGRMNVIIPDGLTG